MTFTDEDKAELLKELSGEYKITKKKAPSDRNTSILLFIFLADMLQVAGLAMLIGINKGWL